MLKNFLVASVVAGLIAGAVFLMLEMLLVTSVQGESPWGPPRMMAAIVMGKSVLPPPADYDSLVIGVAMGLHALLSVIYVIVLGALIRRTGLLLSLLIGIGFGLFLYLINFYGFTVIFPWFAMARNWISLFSHAMFGLVAALVFKLLRRRHSEPQGVYRV